MLCVTLGGNGESEASAAFTPWSAQKTSTHAGDAAGVSVSCWWQSVTAKASSVPSAPGGFARLASFSSALAAHVSSAISQGKI